MMVSLETQTCSYTVNRQFGLSTNSCLISRILNTRFFFVLNLKTYDIMDPLSNLIPISTIPFLPKVKLHSLHLLHKNVLLLNSVFNKLTCLVTAAYNR